jgi:hypothetical protein
MEAALAFFGALTQGVKSSADRPEREDGTVAGKKFWPNIPEAAFGWFC